MMSDQFVINIDLKGLSKQSKSEDSLKTVEGKGAETAQTKEAKATDSLKAGFTAAIAVSYGRQAISSIASARLSSIGATYGDEALQNRVSNVVDVGSQITGTLLATTTAFLANPALGVATASLALLQKAVSMYSNKISWDERRREESLENSRKAERLGIVSSGNSRRNY